MRGIAIALGLALLFACASRGESETPPLMTTRDMRVVDPEPEAPLPDAAFPDAAASDAAPMDDTPDAQPPIALDAGPIDAAPGDQGARPTIDMAVEPDQGGCIEDVDCDGAQICEGGVCLDPPPCVDDAGCAADERCEAGECLPGRRPECAIDADCPNDGRCVDGVCARGECEENTDCAVNERCEGARCVPDLIGCVEHADCGMDEVCVDGVCDPNPQPDCAVADDCPMGQICVAGVCEADGVGACAAPRHIGAFGRIEGSTGGEAAVHGATCGGGATGPERVYSLGLPAEGPICVRTIAADFDAVLHVRRGPCADSEGEVLCDDAAPDARGRSQIDLDLQGEAPAWLFVDGFGAESGAFILEVIDGVCPPLPECLDAAECAAGEICEAGVCAPAPGTCDRPLPLPIGEVNGVTAGASVEAGSCGGADAPEQVFEFTPDVAGPVCFETTGSAYDTVLYARAGGCDGAQLACSDDGQNAGGLQSDVTVDGAAGEAITVIVDGYSNRSGAFVLTASSGPCGGAPAGPCDGLAVVERAAPRMGTTVGAGADDAGSCAPTVESPEVAFRFRAVQAGPICASTAGSAYDTVLYVRTACDDPDSQVGCSDDVELGVDSTSRLTVQAEAGVDYFVFVDGYDSLATGPGQGAFVLTISAGACP